MYKRRLDLTIYVPDGKYCNVSAKDNCRFCVAHCNGHTCALNQEVLEHDGKYIIKTQDCMWLNPAGHQYVEPDITVSAKTLVNTTIDHFAKAYKALRRAGINEEMALDMAKKELKEGK